MSIRVESFTCGRAWLTRPTDISGARSGGGICARVYGVSMSVTLRGIKGDRWRANEAADLLLELYRDFGLRWEAFTVHTDDDRAHYLPPSLDEAPEGWRPTFETRDLT